MSELTQEQEEILEQAYWIFDGRRKGYGQWHGCPQSERDAFKAQYRAIAALLAPTTTHSAGIVF